ncbi:MAG: hypothetical protein HC859_08615 [Bacteroidia bacterium]|nr:hypothetical protein [Bacteroidia bacterium]
MIMIRWKDNATPVDVRAARDLWIGLSQKVNGFDNFSWLVNTHAGNSYYQHVAILDFTSAQARDEYEQHEDHIRLMELGNNVVEAVSEVDYVVK